MNPRAIKLAAAGGVFGGVIATVLGTWYALTRDIHTLKEIEPDALPQLPLQGKTGWRGVDRILDKLRAQSSANGIPLGLMVGWIGMESGGRLSDRTYLNELGLYQLMAKESESIGIDHERLATDLDFSLEAGVKLIKKYAAAVSDLGVAPAGSSYFWRLVKLIHSMGGGQVKKIVNAAKAAGQAGSWEQLERFALDMHVLGPQPKKWFPFVDDFRYPRPKGSVYRAGRPFGFGTEAPAPALVGRHGFDVLIGAA